MTRLRAAIAIAAAAILMAPATAAAARRCAPEQDRVVARSADAVVFHGDQVVFGCLIPKGRRWRLPAQDPIGPPETVIGGYRLAGRFVAYESSAEGYESVYVFDLRRGKTLSAAPGATADPDDEVPPDPSVEALVLRRSGSIAWIGGISRRAGGNTEYEVHAVSARRPRRDRVLDRGSDIDPDSLALSRSGRVYWRHGGEARSAVLHRVAHAGAPAVSAAQEPACDATEPNGRGPRAGPPPEGDPEMHYGDREMGTVVPIDGTVRLRPDRRWTKFPWWIARSESPRLRVRGRRLDARGKLTARVLRAGSRWFHPVIVRFPAPGCWRIIGRTPTARLRFTVLAVEDSAAER
jgi:hypothetical protein